MLRYSCIACPKPRAKGKPFCMTHFKAHQNSAWVKAFRQWQAAVSKDPKAPWVAPRGK